MTIRLGISSCLLGEKVRWNGDHKLDHFLVDTLGRFVEYVPVCPEVESGFSVPREPFRLVGDPDDPRLMTTRSKQDHTERMTTWAKKRVLELEKEDLSGFIFKSKSPSSGMERIKVYNEKGVPAKKGVGMFARAFMDHFPLLPVEDDGRLHDSRLRENFIERVFAHKRWHESLGQSMTRGRLVDFHTRHKLMLLAHSPQHYRMMGKFVAQAKALPPETLHDKYQELLMEALRLKTTPKKNTNVLMHILGYFKKDLSADEKQEMLEVIDLYHQGHVPLIVPITLINHYVRKYDQSYLKGQHYLHPHPMELHLRNHA